MNAKFPFSKIKYILFSLLALMGEQCFCQYYSFIYKSPENADTYITDFEIGNDTSIYFRVNRSCIEKKCTEVVRNYMNKKVKSIATNKSLSFNPLLIDKDILISYTSIRDGNIDSNYWNLDFYTRDLDLLKTYSWKSPDKFIGLNYGICKYRGGNYLLYGSGDHANYPNASPTIMIVEPQGEKLMPMTFYPYDTFNPEINNLEGVYMQHDTAFYFSYQIGKQPHLGQYFYKINSDGKAELKWYLRRFNTRPLRFFVDDDNSLVSFVSTMNSKAVVVYKNDKAGNQLWQKQLPEQFSGQDHLVVNDIIPCKNGDILVSTWAELFDTLSTGEVYNPLIIYLARLSQDGEVKWIRRLSQRGYDGKWKSSSGNKLIETDNGDILIGGTLNREEAIGGYDAWFMRLSANGCLSNECKDEYVTEIGGEIITSTHDLNNVLSRSEELKAYPNPSESKVAIDLPDLNVKLYHYEIIDDTGKKLEQNTILLSDHRLEVDISRYPSGIYFILIKGDKDSKIYKSKVVKL